MAKRAILAVILAAALLVPAVPSHAAEPVELTMTATPSTGLSDGDVITLDTTVTGAIFVVYQCADTDIAEAVATGLGECVLNGVAAPTTVAPPSSATVTRFVKATAGLTDCAVVACSLLMVGLTIGSGSPLPTGLESYATVPVQFTPSRTITAQPGSGSVLASPLLAPAGSAAFVMRCAFLAAGGILCGEVGTIEAPFDGTFVGSVTTDAEWEVEGRVANCLVDACGIAVVVLGPGPTIVDVAGIGDPNF